MDEIKGQLELAVMAAVDRLRGDAYGVSVLDEVCKREGRTIGYGTIHVTLNRLSGRDFLKSKMGAPTAERGGRRKKFYELTGKGQVALYAARNRYAEKTFSWGWAPKPAEG